MTRDVRRTCYFCQLLKLTLNATLLALIKYRETAMSIDLSAKNIDPAFWAGGYYVNEERPAIRCVCTLGGNNAIRACTFEQIEPYFYVLGITPQGAVDPTFGVNGEVRVNVPGATLVAATSMLSAVVDGAEVFMYWAKSLCPERFSYLSVVSTPMAGLIAITVLTGLPC
nr:hypothetical protein [Pseudomonas sp. BIGb0427]